jgi:hypothetical protein
MFLGGNWFVSPVELTVHSVMWETKFSFNM